MAAVKRGRGRPRKETVRLQFPVPIELFRETEKARALTGQTRREWWLAAGDAALPCDMPANLGQLQQRHKKGTCGGPKQCMYCIWRERCRENPIV